MATIDLTHAKSMFNDPFYPMLWDESNYLVFRGGAGSGKSEFCVAKLIFRILSDWNKPFKHRFLALKKTLPYARRTVFPLIQTVIERWGLEAIVTVNKTHMTFTFSNGSEIWVMGLDDSEKVKSIEGVTGIWMEEATEFAIDDFAQLDIRMRGQIDTYYQIMLSFNPVSTLKWVYREFFSNPRPDTTTHFSTYKDNRFLDEKYHAKLEDLVNRDFMKYRVYCLGEWGSLENIIYDNWERVSSFPSDVDNVVIGCDFGYTHPCGVVMLGCDGKTIYVKELIHRDKLTVTRLCQVLKPLIDTEPLLNMATRIYCDDSRPEGIAQMREEGFNALAVAKGRSSVREGIDLIKQYKLMLTKGSQGLINEIQEYKWKEDKDGVVYDEPVKLNDDGMDAMRYAAFMLLRRKSQLGCVFIDM